GRRGRRDRGRRAAAGHGQHAGRGAGAAGDHRARGRGAHVHHQLPGRGRRRSAAGAGRGVRRGWAAVASAPDCYLSRPLSLRAAIPIILVGIVMFARQNAREEQLMVVLAQDLAELTDEFALVDEAAAEAGRAGRCPRVRRSWASVPAGGHISGVIWGEDSPELVFLHDRRESARAWDTVALASARPAAAVDLPGHGRSGWRRDGRYEPARITPAV